MTTRLIELANGSAEWMAERTRLQQERERAFDVLEHGDPCLVLDSQFCYVFVNRAHEKCSGRPREQTLGRCIWDVWPEAADRKLKFWDHYHRVMSDRAALQFEEYFAPLDLWIEVHVFPTSEGGIAIAYRRINDRKHAEAELRAERDFTAAIINTAASLVLVIDAEGKIVRFNKTCQTISGYSEEEVVGKSYQMLIPQDELPPVTEVFQSLTAGMFPNQYENHWQAKDGQRPLLSWSNTAIVDETGKVKFVVATGIDVTERRRAEEALRHANERLVEADRRKNEFLAVLSHELRNPLAPIRSSVYVMEKCPPGSEQSKRALTVIDRQVTHMVRLIDDLLDVTRISKGKIRLQCESMLLNDIVRGAGEDLVEQFQRNGVELEIAVTDQPLRAHVDRTRIAQIVGNLVQNAAKFTPRGGKARLSLEASNDGRAIIEVRDNGAGIDPALVGKLFEPFMQADQTLDRSRGGLGLGLALVKGLAELHGGTASATSEGAGKGAVFTVRLPLEPAR